MKQQKTFNCPLRPTETVLCTTPANCTVRSAAISDVAFEGCNPRDVTFTIACHAPHAACRAASRLSSRALATQLTGSHLCALTAHPHSSQGSEGRAVSLTHTHRQRARAAAPAAGHRHAAAGAAHVEGSVRRSVSTQRERERESKHTRGSRGC